MFSFSSGTSTDQQPLVKKALMALVAVFAAVVLMGFAANGAKAVTFSPAGAVDADGTGIVLSVGGTPLVSCTNDLDATINSAGVGTITNVLVTPGDPGCALITACNLPWAVSIIPGFALQIDLCLDSPAGRKEGRLTIPIAEDPLNPGEWIATASNTPITGPGGGGASLTGQWRVTSPLGPISITP